MAKRFRDNFKLTVDISFSNDVDLFCLLDNYNEKNLHNFKYFINKGFDIETQDENEDTLLTYAVKKNILQVVEFLLDNNANIEHRNKDGLNALLLSIPGNVVHECWDPETCIENEHRNINKITKVLLEKYKQLGISIDCEDKEENTPLLLAIKETRNTFLVKLLLTYGADVHHRNKENKNALLLTIDSINLCEVAEELIKHGADINYEEEDGTTPLLLAIQNCSSYMLHVLLDNDVDIDYINKNRMYPLAEVLLNQDFDDYDVEKMISLGADVRYLEKHHYYALEHAELYKYKIVEEALKKYM
jgi:ankyrin repeat protein